MNLLSRFRFVSLPVLVSCLIFLCALCGHSSAQDFKTLKDGVEYAEVTREVSGKVVQMNLLRLDLSKVRLDVHHAMDAAIGTEKTSSIAARHGAFAAVNAGFFRLDTSIFAGDAAGLLIIDRHLISDSTNDRIVLGLTNNKLVTEVAIGRSELTHFLFQGKREIEISGSNRELATNEIVLYTPYFHRTTLTSKTAIELIVRKDRIVKIVRSIGSSEIPTDGYVLSASGTMASELTKIARVGTLIQIGQRTHIISISHEPDPPKMEYFEDIVAGVPQLIKNGRVDITWEQEKTTKSFVETRHPRTAVAKLKDGKFLMITVDGRSETSGGIGLQDLAEYLLSLGAVDAMNLDGGGSTTMFVDGKVVNKPSDKEGERKVSDAILVTLRNPKK
ncbi:MAG TPA: phosphodiester glycosidase family protein [Pyrinomonadaceae bacterium]|nr:phosphodiester glycosidase family protein [Chloracidobacterium sp.]MBP9935071.1 phosphodiester glycosidase family protein [Pyrinomonadaceae bacterium]MBK7801303.1 phosphodiester glycosidase family protein [Chloracidobacterium sp.]MBL0241612.1 phosphodiester glycosidase family protein [Chloracidobacterium sp.]HQX54771.1 phosphodiester glycosidase family protein [Pyrinomonadaceae bacterium]